jgi:hypothetical protein
MFRRLLPLLAVPFGFACVEPAAPNDTTPPTANLDALPEIPRPVSLTDFGASRSEVQTEVRLLAGDFRPEIDEVTADWAIQAQRTGGSFQGYPTIPTGPCPAAVFEGVQASDRLTNAVSHTCQMNWSVFPPGSGRVPAGRPLVPDSLPRRVLWLDGAPNPASVGRFAETLTRDGTCSFTMPALPPLPSQTRAGPCAQTDAVTYVLRWPQVTTPVYVRRDRWWERRPLLVDGSEAFILEGPVTRTVSFSYSSGSTTTNTEEFARSITVEVGGSYSFFSASVSATLSQTFSTTVEVRRDTTVTVTEELSGEPGVARVMTFWVLVERYSITDADGNPYGDDHYQIPPVDFTDEGRITALLATDFPSTGGAS